MTPFHSDYPDPSLMLTSAFRTLPALAIACGLLCSTGCGSKFGPMVDVKGTLVLPPALKLQPTDSIVVTFLPDGNVTAPGGTANLNGGDTSFTMKMPAGKYKVNVNVQPYPGDKNSATRAKEIEGLVGKFGPAKLSRGSEGATESPLRYEVGTSPQQSVTVDLAKGTVTGS